MSFSKINDIEVDESKRSFIILYNFNNKEILNIKNICRLFGIKDIQILSRKNSNNKILDIINNKIEVDEQEGINHKSMIFNNVNPMKISGVVDSLKKFRMSRPLVAVVTENNINWTLNELVLNLLEEKNALNQGKVLKHK